MNDFAGVEMFFTPFGYVASRFLPSGEFFLERLVCHHIFLVTGENVACRLKWNILFPLCNLFLRRLSSLSEDCV